MVRRLVALPLALAALPSLLILAGCSGGDDAPPETVSSKAAASEAASAWSDEQKAKMKEALSHRRSDSGGPGK